MIYDGINFYEGCADGKTEKEFIEHEKHHGLKEDQLKEVYKLITKKKAVKVPPSSN